MLALDATARTVCTIRRETTNTPVGAFVTLNDPVFVECAQALARLVVEEGGGEPTERAVYAFRRVLGRPPHPAELARLTQLFEHQLEHYRRHLSAAAKLAGLDALKATSLSIDADQNVDDTDGDQRDTQPSGHNPQAELAAWTVVANVLLNLDEALTKN
jgi:hypothetical protein